ncbi:MAG: hypothetical protein HZA64_14110 [Rhodocyclales bacterium]|nr:hypothetical protein [Rhodocyclales bacterium]
MGTIVEFPEANVRAWEVFADGVRALCRNRPVGAVESALEEVRPLFLNAWHSTNFKLSQTTIEGQLRELSTNLSDAVLPLLAEIVRCRIELAERRGKQ